jgi:hypothetical protein
MSIKAGKKQKHESHQDNKEEEGVETVDAQAYYQHWDGQLDRELLSEASPFSHSPAHGCERLLSVVSLFFSLEGKGRRRIKKIPTCRTKFLPPPFENRDNSPPSKQQQREGRRKKKTRRTRRA